jgi:hypothetical protein
MYSVKSKLALIIISLLIILSVNACNQSADAFTPGTYPVDPTFSDFYRGFGSVSFLGPAISPSFEKEGITYQYIVSGLMVYDPGQMPLTRFHFSPIASIEWKINDLVEPVPMNSEVLYVNGHRIWEEASSFYNRYGADIIGLPVSGVTANDEKQRYEQYFEGLGFYRNYSEPAGQIQLMPYGYWMCGENCQYQETDESKPAASYARDFSETEQLFLQISDNLGYGYTGAPVDSPYKANDGNYEMVFENAILFIDPSNGNQIMLRPLPAWLGIQIDTPTSEIKADWLSFYQISDNLGYNVPNLFSVYIAAHGGAAYSGNPITEYRILPDGGYTQCFTNICLEYHPTSPEDLRTRPHALGIEYLTNGTNITVPNTSFADALQINVYEQYPLIPSGQNQVINIEALQNDAPMRGIELSLVVKQPDGITKTYTLNPTREDGTTSIELDKINGPNGAIVQYKVCVLGAVSPQICFSRSYTIWDQ